jgi:class 3 adenylate cyclase
MNEAASRTLVASVLFLDIVGYSTLGVGEQLRLKRKFNGVLLAALEDLAPEERVVLDTGDGAAITILDNPERALLLALALFDRIGELQVRGGVNLGPVSLLNDVNGQPNVIGDGINVAQRIMDFAEREQLLVSHSFFEVVTRMSADYASIFSDEGSRSDKHGRTHQVFAVRQGVRVARRLAEAHTRRPAERATPAGEDTERPALAAPRLAAAQISDAGSHYIVSGYSEAAVRQALEQLAAAGGTLSSPISSIGAKWMASVNKPGAAGASVQDLGFTRIVSGPTRESVEVKVRELLEYGASIVQHAELVDGVWTAVCEKRG